MLLLLSTTLLLAASLQSVVGHGHLVDPVPAFTDKYGDPSKFAATLNGPTVLPGSSYEQGPDWNTDQFTKHFKASSFKTLKAFLDAYPTGGDCGITDSNGPAQPLPSTVKWANGQEGFISSHQGPCELWCDETRVFQDDNCAANVPDGFMSIDTSKCSGAKRLTMLWLALHTPEWQVYKNCVNLSGVAPGPGPNPNPSPSPSGSSGPSPSPTPEYPSPRPSPRPSVSPTPSPSVNPNDPIQGWKQCGGAGYSGNTKCVNGFQCTSLSLTYSQCMPYSNNKGQVTRYGQCGGLYYTGSTECSKDDSCVASGPWFSQCLPGAN
ncbi:hypothetical protein SDRG_16534 [Saprolegnia diclina VS20]|uniref:CBM1 domain-containing protein n=1 Tax=Saprolegnia diclina (strain VS20) TaxID=1156394 RepID=T0R0U9_SAPDV|nr:hypothetical protein SDRG_16534 [Saprolegnia diclina VS20]EQC25603.1 hypothetical protein SDRG_16534 [Saprolegnia diclina VS20]|eukprot:XP_008620971.1 hypothetical protein SDRG_16534 [Saprolegnia diclina VS20]